MTDVPTLYLHSAGRLYPIKVFPSNIGIERQTTASAPHGPNLPFTTVPDLYDGQSWDFDAISTLIAQYEPEIVIDQDTTPRPARSGAQS